MFKITILDTLEKNDTIMAVQEIQLETKDEVLKLLKKLNFKFDNKRSTKKIPVYTRKCHVDTLDKLYIQKV